MTLEEVKKFLKENTEGKDYLQSLIDKEIEGLKEKNNELLGKNKKLRDEKLDLSDKIEGLEDQVKKFKKDPDDKDDKNNDRIKALSDEIEKLKTEKSEMEANTKREKQNAVIDKTLNEALLKNNIAKQFLKTVFNDIKVSNKIDIVEDSDGSMNPVVGNKSLTDFIRDYSQSDEGKVFVAAGNNSGGGAKGSGSGSNGTVDFSKMTPNQKMEYGRKNPQNKS